MANASKKPRKANFSHSETLALLEGILEKKDVVMSSFGSDLINRDKCSAWRVIAEKVSSVGDVTRSPGEVREKFYNLKRDHRARTSARKKTGNGGVAIKPYDELIEMIVGKDSELVEGVKGVGHDHVFKASQFSIISGSDALHVDNCSSYCSSNTTVLASNNVTLMEMHPKLNREQACIDWHSFIRDVCAEDIRRHPVELGGLDHQGMYMMVEIDECKYFHRKYHRGAYRDGHWVFGAYERETGRCLHQEVPDRRAATLQALVRQWLCQEPG